MIKWHLMFNTLPFVLGAIAVKVAIDLGFGWAGLIDFSDMSLVLTGGVFLIGLMLSGTMADYKESEKIPAELACAVESFEECVTLAAASRPALDRRRGLQSALEILDATLAWLHRRNSQAAAFAALERGIDVVADIERAGGATYANRASAELATVRKLVTRMGVVSQTNFLAPGYALLETLTALVIALLMIAKFKYLLAEVLLVGFITLIFVYMVKLIRDIDDPFEYGVDGERGSSEVALFPLHDYAKRLRSKLAATAQDGLSGPTS